MDFLLPLLSMFTLLVFAVLAYRSGQKAHERARDPNAPKSTLAPENDSHGKPADV